MSKIEQGKTNAERAILPKSVDVGDERLALSISLGSDVTQAMESPEFVGKQVPTEYTKNFIYVGDFTAVVSVLRQAFSNTDRVLGINSNELQQILSATNIEHFWQQVAYQLGLSGDMARSFSKPLGFVKNRLVTESALLCVRNFSDLSVDVQKELLLSVQSFPYPVLVEGTVDPLAYESLATTTDIVRILRRINVLPPIKKLHQL